MANIFQKSPPNAFSIRLDNYLKNNSINSKDWIFLDNDIPYQKSYFNGFLNNTNTAIDRQYEHYLRNKKKELIENFIHFVEHFNPTPDQSRKAQIFIDTMTSNYVPFKQTNKYNDFFVNPQEFETEIKTYLSSQRFVQPKMLSWTKTNPPFAKEVLNQEFFNKVFYFDSGKKIYKFNSNSLVDWSSKLHPILQSYSSMLWNKFNDYCLNHNENTPIITQLQQMQNSGNSGKFGFHGQNIPHQNIPDDIYALILNKKDLAEREDYIKLYNSIQHLPSGKIKEEQLLLFKRNLKNIGYKDFILTYKLYIYGVLLTLLFFYVFGETTTNINYLFKTRNINDMKIAFKDYINNKFSSKGYTIPKNTQLKDIIIISSEMPNILKLIKFSDITDPFKLIEIVYKILITFPQDLNNALTPSVNRSLPKTDQSSFMYEKINKSMSSMSILFFNILNSPVYLKGSIKQKIKNTQKILVYIIDLLLKKLNT